VKLFLPAEEAEESQAREDTCDAIIIRGGRLMAPRRSEEGHDRRDKTAAWELAQLWGERMPIGVLYQEERPTHEDQEPALQAGPLVKREPRELTPEQVGRLKGEFI